MNSAAFDVAIGLMLMYLLLSLLCTVVNEIVAQMVGLRSATLESGLAKLLDDPAVKQAFYDHGLIASAKAGSGRHPSYLSGTTFAMALLGSLDTAQPLPGFADINTAVGQLGDSRIKDALQAHLTAAENDLTRLRDGLAHWFDDAMDRLSGTYKRNLRLISLVVAAVVAAGANADSITVAKALWSDPAAREQVTSSVDDALKLTDATGTAPKDGFRAVEDQLRPFPLGWTGGQPAASAGWRAVLSYWLAKAAGLLATTLALSLGAPFWFDTLTRVGNIRSTGTKPARTGTA